MTIKKVSIIGLGALGVMYANHLSHHMPYQDLRIIVDGPRRDRYEKEGVFCNGTPCRLNYVLEDAPCTPADLLIFTVKYTHLKSALNAVKNQVGPNTIILSALNGVVSEEEIAGVYGENHLLYCVAQGMDAVKENNQMRYRSMGLLCFGAKTPANIDSKVQILANFFDQVSMPYEINNDMALKIWSKLMANVGVNQTVAVAKATTAIVQKEGLSRDHMIAAMEEVLLVANAEGVALTKDDVSYWLEIIDHLNPQGMPSMAQDVKARRFSEVELFAGTIIKLAKKHGLDVPINQYLYDALITIEADY